MWKFCLLFFSLFSHAAVPSSPVVMAAGTVAVACSPNAERWEPYSPIDKPPLLFSPSVLSLHGPRAGTAAEVCDEVDNVKLSILLKERKRHAPGNWKVLRSCRGRNLAKHTIKLVMNSWTSP